MTGSTSHSIYSEGRASGSALGEASFGWTRRSVRFSTFNVEVDARGTGIMADVGGFGDEDGIGDMGTTGAPLLDSADLGPLLPEGLATRGFEFFREGFELAFGLFDQVLDLVSPGFRVVEGVDHLFEGERKF